MIAKSPELPVKSHSLRHVDDYLEVGQKAGASDIHLATGAQPRWRLHGRLEAIWPDAPLLTAEQTAALAEAFVPDVYKNELNTRGDSDFAYENEFARYRTSVVRHCHVTQREIFTHTDSFATALRASLREDPDVIMVGEMRDLETISLAITAAETGHLVLATLHTSSAARTLDRLLDVFPPHQQEQIRVMVSESLRGIISHQLIPRADGTGRVLALEILTNTPAVANVIREAKTYMLPGIIQTGKKQGMRLMDDTLIELYQRGLISAQDAYARAEQKQMVRQHLNM